MDIGEQKRVIVVEPIKDPANLPPAKEPAPVPAKEPATTPSR